MESSPKGESEELQDSVLSSSSFSGLASSTDASFSEESAGGGGSWFGLSDISSFAQSIKRSIPPAIDSIADIIQRSAMTVAAEFTQLERDAEERRWQDAVENGDIIELPLPWELPSIPGEEQTDPEPVYVEDETLKEHILALSLVEETFMTPFVDTDDQEPDFELDNSRIHLMRRLLVIDTNLNEAHARIAENYDQNEMQEIIFWKNYFYHCNKLRSDHESIIVEKEQTLIETDDRAAADLIESSTTASRGFDSCCGVVSFSSEDPSPPPHSISTGDLVLVGFEGDDLDDLVADIGDIGN
uniref:BSD domain-containing protein n=1 Tax=Ditylum brightwellii TaxID=49249 RepID=A0A6U3Q2W2_9STRA|mmetsp:Transcript_17211/g.25615  ORF Transcript_17211/g.25615 Transcript_17211/m.25615 type:complete len:300 (+) Transcript_17211:120-1019(+)